MQTAGKLFLEQTKISQMGGTKKTGDKPPLQLPQDKEAKIIDLPDHQGFEPVQNNIKEIIVKRRSIRSYEQKGLTQAELSYLLWCTQGVKEVYKNTVTFRTVPSAGARHAFETYLLVNNVSGLQPGLYRYMALEHKLAEVDTSPGLADTAVAGCLGQEFIKRCAVTFIWVAVAERMVWRYGPRGYRYLFLDAGHVCQNLYLAAESIDSGVCAVAAYSDDDMNTLLKLDGEEHFVIYIAAAGKRDRPWLK